MGNKITSSQTIEPVPETAGRDGRSEEVIGELLELYELANK